MPRSSCWTVALSAAALVALASTATPLFAQEGRQPGEPAAERPDFPPFAEVAKGFTKVNSSADAEPSLYGVYTREKDQGMLLELPKDFAHQRHLFAMTVASGETYAGLQGPELYVYWKRFDKRLALIEPQITTRSTGDAESKVGVQRVFTDRVVLDVPIIALGPGGGPVIDGKALLAGQVGRFFGGGGAVPGAAAGTGGAGANPGLAVIKKAKAFPQNVEIEFELPTGGGILKTFHYSISLIPDNTGYVPRPADERIGYFQTWYRDLGKYREDDKWVRYINRWDLQKADPSLKLSPPKKPIIYYVEYTVPVRYRRYVRDGALWWNKAFEKIGITDAIEVYIQDKASGAHMEKDPEDVRYNFLRWVTNDVATAIGPSRAHPLTGQILDADIVLTDGWIRAFWHEANEIIPDIAMRGMNDETIAWLADHPDWDPRVRLAPPEQREAAIAKIQNARRGVLRFGGVAASGTDVLRDPATDPASPMNCLAAQGKAFDMALARMSFDLLDMIGDPPEGKDEGKGDKKDEKKKDDKPKTELIDGIPEWFVGQALEDLTAHEVGHTLGLRHNFKGSAAYSFKDINSNDFKGKKPFTASVMDYNPVNITLDKNLVQGDFNQRDIGAYDQWAIEYGYTFDDPKKVLSRVAEPELQFGSDEDAGGIDPTVRRYDFGADPLDYANSRIQLATFARGRIIDKFVKNGDSWAKARRAYLMTLNMQADAISIMSNWVGGARVFRDRKGDPNGRPPIEVVPAAQQRAALKFVIDEAFNDDAFGLTPDLLKYLTIDRFEDPGAGRSNPDWPIHDQIAGLQVSALSQLINPIRLRHVYDNESRVPADQDTLTLPELLDTIVNSIWTELDNLHGGTARQPSISSLRRNLQRECVDRLIDLTMPGTIPGEAGKPISNLALAKLRELKARIDAVKDNGDPYTKAHLAEASIRIGKALDAQYIYNQSEGGLSPALLQLLLGGQNPAAQPANSAPGQPASTGDDWMQH